MKPFMILLTSIFMLSGCAKQPENPLLADWDTPFETPPFNLIEDQHFMPAYEVAMKAEMAEVQAIIDNPEAPNFQNTVEALEKSGKLLSRIDRVFGCLNGANTNDSLQSVSKRLAPLLSKHSDDIYLNDKLFARIKAVYEDKDNLNLTDEQLTLLDNFYKGFVRSGAGLDEADKQILRGINEELSNLYVRFRQNHLAQTNAIGLVIENKADLAGLSDEVISAAAELAKNREMEGKWA
ncbi:MAG: peptidase M3, partial [Calditrichales bacterium]